MDQQRKLELEAATFRKLRNHLLNRTDVQNIDLMNLAGFCRNCLSRWYQEAAKEKDMLIDKETARELFYGMPYSEWIEQYQTEATLNAKALFTEREKE